MTTTHRSILTGPHRDTAIAHPDHRLFGEYAEIEYAALPVNYAIVPIMSYGNSFRNCRMR
jgi:hypothetical protein